jgi:hypothetical protein
VIDHGRLVLDQTVEQATDGGNLPLEEVFMNAVGE